VAAAPVETPKPAPAPKPRAVAAKAKGAAGLDAVAACQATSGEVAYYPARPGHPRAGYYRQVTTTNPFCVLKRAAAQPVQDYDEALIAAEREWLSKLKDDPTAKTLGVEPVVKAIPDSLQGAMRREYVRQVAMPEDMRPAGYDQAIADTRAAVEEGDLRRALQIGSSYINSLGGAYCVHDSTYMVNDPSRKGCKTYTGPASWASQYAMPLYALAMRGGGDCRDHGVDRWAFLKMAGYPVDRMAVEEGGHGDHQSSSIVHVWNEFLDQDGHLYVADYPSKYMDRALVPMSKASWLSNVGAMDVATEGSYAGFGMLRPIPTEVAAAEKKDEDDGE
jgi:hypothetical protein